MICAGYNARMTHSTTTCTLSRKYTVTVFANLLVITVQLNFHYHYYYYYYIWIILEIHYCIIKKCRTNVYETFLVPKEQNIVPKFGHLLCIILYVNVLGNKKQNEKKTFRLIIRCIYRM